MARKRKSSKKGHVVLTVKKRGHSLGVTKSDLLYAYHAAGGRCQDKFSKREGEKEINACRWGVQLFLDVIREEDQERRRKS